MRRCLLLLVALVAPAACSGGGGLLGPERACELLDRLEASAETLGRADLSDPDTFADAIEQARASAGRTLEALAEVVPDRLDGAVEQLRAAVDRQRYEDAPAARAALDDYAAQACGA